MLACLDMHQAPVNCVRWNNVGTLFASCGDDCNTVLWEYKGEKSISILVIIYLKSG